MPRFGICSQDDYIKAGSQRRFSGSRVSYTLLDVGEEPTKEQIQVFEDISFTLRTSNGTYRTTYRNRFRDADDATIRILEQLFQPEVELLVEDRAASHALTSLELAQRLFPIFSNTTFEASDKLLYLIQLSFGSTERYIFEPDGRPLQYINPPFVVGLCHRESLPFSWVVAAYASTRLRRLSLPTDWMNTPPINGHRVSRIPCVHPEALSFTKKNPRFQLRTRSVFDISPNAVHVIRTMNILNKAYFSDAQLSEGADAVFQSLKVGGIWIVGRTLEDDFSNHVTFLQKRERDWVIVHRMGNGSEMEEFVNRTPIGHPKNSHA